MRSRGMLMVALVLVGAREVRAETWSTRIDLVAESSAQTCTEVPQVIWTLSLEAGTFSGINNFGATFSTRVGPDASGKRRTEIVDPGERSGFEAQGPNHLRYLCAGLRRGLCNQINSG